MKPNNFKHSMLTVGVIAALGMTHSALAAEATQVDNTVEVTNQATATYNVDGVKQPDVTSNKVTVSVTKQLNFSLVDDRTSDVTPEGNVTFNHTLTNKGNVEDTYTVDVTNATGDDFDFNEVTVKYKKEGESTYTDLPSNKKITLEPGKSVDIQVTAKAVDNDKGEQGKLTVTATSDMIPDGGSDANKLTNTDTATTKTPVFAITKALTTDNATIQQGSNATIGYKIIVRNTGNMDADDVTITDSLPDGMKFAATPNVVVKRGDTVITNNVTVNTDNDTLTITSIDIAQASGTDQDITVTFDTQVKPEADTTNNTFQNKATVTDDVNGTTITDSTDDGENIPGDKDDDNDDNPPVVTITNSSVDITPNTDITLPPKGKTVVKHTISNDGTVTEDNLKLNLETVDGKDVSEITQTFYVDKDKDGEIDPGEEYTLGEKLPTLQPGETIDILVKETADNAKPGDDGTPAEREKYKLTVTGAANTPSVIDTIDVAGLELKKEQAVAECNTTPAAGDYSKSAATAIPGQCIFYKITAINHLPTTNPTDLQALTDVQVSDTIKQLGTAAGQVTYQNDHTGNNIVVSYAEPKVSGTANTLGAGETATVTFSVQVNK